MIGPVLCLLLPALGSCPAYVDNVPSLHRVEADQVRYSGKMLNVTGRVRKLDQWYSVSGQYPYEIFFICEQNDCVHVYAELHSPIHDGELVSVRGPYYQNFHGTKETYHNEIEATEIVARE